MPPKTATLPKLPAPSHQGWSELGRMVLPRQQSDQAIILRELKGWPWRLRRVGSNPGYRLAPTLRLDSSEDAWLRDAGRVYAGRAADLEESVSRPDFARSYGVFTRVVEVLDREPAREKTLRAFRAARAVIHRLGPLPEGPWAAVEGMVSTALSPRARRLALHGPATVKLGWELSYRPLHGLWMSHDPGEDGFIDALRGGNLQAHLTRFWCGSMPVEKVLAAGEWPHLVRLGGFTDDPELLSENLHNAPRLRTLDVDAFRMPDLQGLVNAGVRSIGLSGPAHLAPLLQTPWPRGLRTLHVDSPLTKEHQASFAAWANGRFVYEGRPAGLAWLGY